ncbi:hypothetical protein NDU88_003091 [Pleurodeles waltl]|uniref:Uncharacterized protein n=1 Tax=Pleurodeles waltl TaxID=8319 RepID=A0AAV7W4N4_PLEWA|nr:hypothetical protein NDU88_003091 [Pleurodeles waltl]
MGSSGSCLIARWDCHIGQWDEEEINGEPESSLDLLCTREDPLDAPHESQEHISLHEKCVLFRACNLSEEVVVLEKAESKTQTSF